MRENFFMSRHATSFKPTLGLFDATMIVAGSMIGSGIFIVSADITRNVGSAGWLIAVWLITGFMTLTAAVSYGELSAMFPKAGGQYVYLKEAYNPLVGFLYGWSFFAVIQTGTIAAVGVAFSKFAGYFFPALELKDENILMQIGSLKIFPAQLVAIVLIIFLKPGVWSANWSNAWDMKSLTADGGVTAVIGTAVLGAIAASMVGSIFSSDAWNNVTFIAGEIKNPKRNIGLSLFPVSYT